MKKVDIYKARGILATYLGYKHSKLHTKKAPYDKGARYLLPGDSGQYIHLQYLEFEKDYNLLMLVKEKIEGDQKTVKVVTVGTSASIIGAKTETVLLSISSKKLSISLFELFVHYILSTDLVKNTISSNSKAGKK